MKTNHWLILAAVFSSGVLAWQAPAADAPAAAAAAKKAARPVPAETPAEPLPPGPAMARQNHANIRAQAAINSEVVGQLKRGDRVTVLEEVVLKQPKTDEPARWAKIALPAGAAVWIHTQYVDTASKTVNARRLNLRAGPGENFSVLGRVEKGYVVHELDAKGEWLKIEAPTNAYAFVASHLLTKDTAPPPVIAAVEPPKPAPAPAEPPVETTVTPPLPPALAQEPAGTPPAPPPPAEATPAPVTPPADTAPTALPAVTTAPELPLVEEPKRIVTREGIVRRSVSIQAPTYFVLESLDTGRAINYLFSTNMALRDYKGRRIVVTGEEVLDERWPNTPVITVEHTNHIEVIP